MIELHPDLDAGLQRWRPLNYDLVAREISLGANAAGSDLQRQLIDRWADDARMHLPCLLADNSDKSPEELKALAAKLSPGGAHIGAWLIQSIESIKPLVVDPLLRSAIVYYNWTGGKVGFQFLSDPAEVDLYDYQTEAFDLLDELMLAVGDDPLKILVHADAAYYRSLPPAFTVYRGCSGVTEEHASCGVCWTTRRDIAEWFACRFATADKPPRVMTARV